MVQASFTNGAVIQVRPVEPSTTSISVRTTDPTITKTYVHDQAEASDRWNINHKMRKYPSVTVVDSTDTVVEGSVTYIDENNLAINFNGAFKGKAYLN